MSYLGLLNQTSTVYNKTGHGGDGRETVGSGTVVACRAEEKTKMRMTPSGEPVRIDITFFYPSDTAINVDDRISYSSVDYKVITRSVLVDGRGATRHLEIEAQRWQS